MAPMPVVALVLNCPKCGRGGEATISEDVTPSVGHSDFVVHTISPEFTVINASPLAVTLSVATAGRSISYAIPNCPLLTAAASIVTFADGKRSNGTLVRNHPTNL
jgi:hypothetical protein